MIFKNILLSTLFFQSRFNYIIVNNKTNNYYDYYCQNFAIKQPTKKTKLAFFILSKHYFSPFLIKLKDSCTSQFTTSYFVFIWPHSPDIVKIYYFYSGSSILKSVYTWTRYYNVISITSNFSWNFFLAFISYL